MGLIYNNVSDIHDKQNGNYIKVSFVGGYTLKPIITKYESYDIRKKFNKLFNNYQIVSVDLDLLI